MGRLDRRHPRRRTPTGSGESRTGRPRSTACHYFTGRMSWEAAPVTDDSGPPSAAPEFGLPLRTAQGYVLSPCGTDSNPISRPHPRRRSSSWPSDSGRRREPADAVRREMREETGYLPKKVKKLGGFYSAPGFCTEYLHLYLATELEPRRLVAEDTDSITLERINPEEIAQLIQSGEICDAKSIAGLLTWLDTRNSD